MNIGRRVRSEWHQYEGTIKRWDPFSTGMTDTLVEDDAGKLCWFALHSLKPADGKGPLDHAHKAACEQIVDELIAEEKAAKSDPCPYCGSTDGTTTNGGTTWPACKSCNGV